MPNNKLKPLKDRVTNRTSISIDARSVDQVSEYQDARISRKKSYSIPKAQRLRSRKSTQDANTNASSRRPLVTQQNRSNSRLEVNKHRNNLKGAGSLYTKKPIGQLSEVRIRNHQVAPTFTTEVPDSNRVVQTQKKAETKKVGSSTDDVTRFFANDKNSQDNESKLSLNQRRAKKSLETAIS